MRLLIAGEPTHANEKFVFLDTDFLSALFQDESFLSEVLELLKGSLLMIDSLTRFEFLRDVFLFEQRTIKEKFINSEIFTPTIDRHETSNAIQDNALILSKIVAHQGQKTKCQKTTPDLVDLFLAGRTMLYAGKTLIATGNKQHYPSYIFDTTAVLNYERNDSSSFSHYFLLEFNEEKFNKCSSDLKRITDKIDK